MTNAEIKKIIDKKWADEGSCMRAKVIKNSENEIKIKESYLESIITIHISDADDGEYLMYWTESNQDDEIKRGYMIISDSKYADHNNVEDGLRDMLVRIGYSTAMRY